MQSIQSALLNKKLISDKQYTAITRIKERSQIIDNQLNHLYKNTNFNNLSKIALLEGQLKILNFIN